MTDHLMPTQRSPDDPDKAKEAEKTNRAAIEGWGPTLRIVFIRTVPAVRWALAPVLYLVATWLLFYR